MNFIETDISGLLIVEPKIFDDDRGFFYESFNQQIFNEAVGHKIEFVQDNHSKSAKGVLRGLHFQNSPYAQGKLVRCTKGEVYDVAVDIRDNSSTFGHWFGVILSDKNHRQLWIPEGFAHGFLTLSEHAEFLYKTTSFYNPLAENCIKWDDKYLNIDWPIRNVVTSEKDSNASSFNDIFSGSNK